MCLCEGSVRLNIRRIARLNGTLITVPEESGLLEKCHFLATQEITVWKLHHQNELTDSCLKKNSVPSKQMHVLSIYWVGLTWKVPFAQFMEKSLCVQGRGWAKRKHWNWTAGGRAHAQGSWNLSNCLGSHLCPPAIFNNLGLGLSLSLTPGL